MSKELGSRPKDRGNYEVVLEAMARLDLDATFMTIETSERASDRRMVRIISHGKGADWPKFTVP